MLGAKNKLDLGFGQICFALHYIYKKSHEAESEWPGEIMVSIHDLFT